MRWPGTYATINAEMKQMSKLLIEIKLRYQKYKNIQLIAKNICDIAENKVVKENKFDL